MSVIASFPKAQKMQTSAPAASGVALYADHLELLGFGTPAEATVNVVKEL